MTSFLDSRRNLLRQLARGNLSQPATVLWRLFEIEAIQRHVSFHGRVLDLGCGDGSLTRVTIAPDAHACQLVGLEPDALDAKDARSSGLYVAVHEASGAAIPEEDESFDTVFSNSVLEHIPDLQPVLAEVARVLKPGGDLVITVPSEQFHDCLTGRGIATALAVWRGETATQAIDRRLRHCRYWSADEWRRALKAVGLEIVETHRYFPLAAVRAWERLSDLTGGVAFELFRRRNETRTLQRRLRFDLLDRLVPESVRTRLLQLIMGSNLNIPADVSSGPSGGLLVYARRPQC